MDVDEEKYERRSVLTRQLKNLTLNVLNYVRT